MPGETTTPSCPGIEGGYTQYFGGKDVPAPDTNITALGDAKPTFIYTACMAYQEEGTPLVVIGGEDYGMGSSRYWAAKGTRLLGVKAVSSPRASSASIDRT